MISIGTHGGFFVLASNASKALAPRLILDLKVKGVQSDC